MIPNQRPHVQRYIHGMRRGWGRGRCPWAPMSSMVPSTSHTMRTRWAHATRGGDHGCRGYQCTRGRCTGNLRHHLECSSIHIKFESAEKEETKQKTLFENSFTTYFDNFKCRELGLNFCRQTLNLGIKQNVLNFLISMGQNFSLLQRWLKTWQRAKSTA